MKLNYLTIFVAFLFFSLGPNIYSQEKGQLGLNSDFLDSLPDEVREDLLEEIEGNQSQLEEVDYGALSSLFKDPAAKYIEQELLRSEIPTIPPQEIPLEDLKFFGEEFFRGLPLSFMPISDPSLSSDYVVGVGDTLNVNIVGINNINEGIKVAKDGTLTIKQVGKLNVSGLTLSQAEKRLQVLVSQNYPGSNSSLALSELESVQVLVLGMVNYPGLYTISGNSTVLNAISSAGGLNASGSLRNIIVKSRDGTTTEYDLYDLLIDGDVSSILPIRAGDSINVLGRKKYISIYGGVNRPAKYEIKDESLSRIIDFAGGIIPPSPMSIYSQSLDGNNYVSREISIKNIEKIKAENLDIYNVNYSSVANKVGVEIFGSLASTGKFSLERAKKVILNNAFLDDAYPITVAVINQNNPKSNGIIRFRSLTNLSDLTDGDSIYAFNRKDISFINSKLVKDFFRDIENNIDFSKSNNYSCKLFEYLQNISKSERLLIASSFFDKINNLPGGESKSSQVSDLMASEIPESTDSIFKRNEPESNCPKIFERFPELFLSALMSSVEVEGKSLMSGLYPIYSGIQAKSLFNYLQISSVPDAGDLELTSNDNGQTLPIKLNGSNLIYPMDKLTFNQSNSLRSNKVTIRGEVKKPGVYFVGKSETLSDVINRANGFTENGYPLGGVLVRQSAKSLEIEYNKTLYDQVIKSLATVITQGKNISFDGLNLILEEFKNLEPQGRVITEFDPIKIRSNPTLDILLENNDFITIPKRTGIVYVFGDVIRPGPQKYNPGQSTKYYISNAGGLNDFADKDLIISVSPNGESRIIKNSLFSGSGKNIMPGSVIYVSRDLRKLESIELAATIAPIISSIAISLASLNSISDN